MKEFFRTTLAILKNALNLLNNSNPLVLSASTAFFTTFGLSPILINLAHLLTLFFDQDIILGKLFTKVATSVGEKAAHDVKRIVENFLSFETNAWVTIPVTIFFYFVGTTLLTNIRQCIHQIWRIKRKPEHPFGYHLKERLIEIGIILLIGVLFLISTVFDNGIDHISSATSVTNGLLHGILSIVMVSTWITLIFRLMPEAYVQWRVAIAGGLFTGVLINIGRFTLTKLLVTDEFRNLFGPSASMALLLLFIFYCSLTLYFGTAFTYVYGKTTHQPIRPGHHADKYEQKVIEEGSRKRKSAHSKDKVN
jgi:membrane protein